MPLRPSHYSWEIKFNWKSAITSEMRNIRDFKARDFTNCIVHGKYNSNWKTVIIGGMRSIRNFKARDFTISHLRKGCMDAPTMLWGAITRRTCSNENIIFRAGLDSGSRNTTTLWQGEIFRKAHDQIWGLSPNFWETHSNSIRKWWIDQKSDQIFPAIMGSGAKYLFAKIVRYC